MRRASLLLPTVGSDSTAVCIRVAALAAARRSASESVTDMTTTGQSGWRLRSARVASMPLGPGSSRLTRMRSSCAWSASRRASSMLRASRSLSGGKEVRSQSRSALRTPSCSSTTSTEPSILGSANDGCGRGRAGIASRRTRPRDRSCAGGATQSGAQDNPRRGSPYTPLLQRNEAALDGEAHQARHVADAQLLHQPCAVSLYRFLRQRQPLGDLGAGAALGEELQHLPLARRKPRQGVVALFGIVVDHHVGDARAEIALAGVYRPDRLADLPARA